MSDKKKITVTSPLLPPLEEFFPYLKDIWERKWITNNGHYHNELEKALCRYLGVEYISIFTNGTLPLMTALQALEITGEVITTPYSFVATAHSIWWTKTTPVFVDIDPLTGNIDPSKIEAAITDKTAAIMPVHVYGTPCDTKRIKEIADKHNLKVIYDAAHAFGVKVDGRSILQEGDISTLSFHATKTYNTIEGGALICHSEEMKRKVDQLKNFGFTGEVSVELPGINGKMDELRAAYGLLALDHVDKAILNRKKVAERYRMALKDVKGISLLEQVEGVEYNYSYFPIFVDEQKYGMSRDALYEKMKSEGVFGRRYFYPLITAFTPYNNLPGADMLPVATELAERVICLPMHHSLSDEDVERVINVIIL